MYEQQLPCPVCQTKIPFDVNVLLQGGKFSCQSCGAGIGISSESIGEAEKAMQKFDELKKTAAQIKEGAA